jgi:hypothetical protein
MCPHSTKALSASLVMQITHLFSSVFVSFSLFKIKLFASFCVSAENESYLD